MKFFHGGKSEDTGRLRLPLSAWLSYLLVATLLFTGVSFSKFAATASGSDSVTVAGFNVTASSVPQSSSSQSIDLGDTDALNATWSFTVTSNSEVAATDTVTVTLNDALPGGVSMSMTVNGSNISGTLSGNTYTYTKDFEVGSSTHNWVLTFIGDPDDESAVTDETELVFTIKTDVVQKD